MRNKKLVYQLVSISLIAALYTTVSMALAPISFGNIQVRIAEALTLLPIFYAPSIIGVTLGCFLTNLIGMMMGINLLGAIDVIVGTFATGIAAIMTYKLSHIQWRSIPFLSILPPILINAIVIGLELTFVLNGNFDWIYFGIFAFEVGMGQLISCGVGLPLALRLRKSLVFLNN